VNIGIDNLSCRRFSLAVCVVPDTNEEPDADSRGDMPDPETSDGIRRGEADVMGSREEGVRADEIETLEEGESH
jgi:hypothetical protein